MNEEIVIVDAEVIENVQEEKQITIKERAEVQREVLSFDKLMDMADKLAKSTIVPVMYQNRPENVFIALDMASRMGISPLVVMQNLYVVNGKPSWSGSAIASLLNASPKFKNVELIYCGTPNTDSWGAFVVAENANTGKKIKGGTVTLAISKKEGWFQKSGSKWQTMPEIMLAYRAYAWFGRVHAPELMMGLQSSDEIEDTIQVVNDRRKVENPFEKGEQ